MPTPFGEKGKANKKAKRTVAVGVCRFFTFFALFSHFFALWSHFFFRFVFPKSSHKRRSGTRKKQINKTNAKTQQIALLLHFHLLLCFSFSSFFHKKKLFDGWSCMAAWLPLPNTLLDITTYFARHYIECCRAKFQVKVSINLHCVTQNDILFSFAGLD